MEEALFETEIECSVTMTGAEIARVVVHDDRLEFSKLKTGKDIPSQVMITDIQRVRFSMTRYLDFKISLRYRADGQEKVFDFVTCNTVRGDVGEWEGVSNPIKTFKLYRLIKKLVKKASPGM